jgi:hypothetical protein
MTNHYHLLVGTIDGNLSKGMRQLKRLSWEFGLPGVESARQLGPICRRLQIRVFEENSGRELVSSRRVPERSL